MAVRQYIGARYVIKIYENSLDPSSAEWEGGVAYEPLTLVTYNNSSYLSKKDVPNSIGDPATNPSYWVVTGAYNGQIAQLQNDVGGLQNDVLNLRDDVDSIPVSKKVLIFGDSYMFGIGGDGLYNDVERVMESISGWDVSTYAEQGIGYIRTNGDGHNCLSVIQTAIENESHPELITDVVLACSVYNEMGMVGYPEFSESGFLTALTACVNAIKGAFINANISIAPALWTCTTYITNYTHVSKWEENAAKLLGLNYAKGAINWLMPYDTTYDSGDSIHPSHKGYEVIAGNITSLIRGTAPILFSACDEITTNTNDTLVVTARENTVHITGTIKKETGQSFYKLCDLPTYCRHIVNVPCEIKAYVGYSMSNNISALMYGTELQVADGAFTDEAVYIIDATLPMVPWNP